MMQSSTQNLIIGLTGGIASGKTAAADYLAQRGAHVIDTDKLAREVVKPGTEGLAEIVNVFGEAILQADGALDRGQLRNAIFKDEQARNQLNAIMHPRIEKAALAHIEQYQQSDQYIVLVIPLLVETNARSRYPIHRTLVVDVTQDTQRARLMQRDNIDTQLAQQMIDAQASRSERLEAADELVTNDGTLEQLHSQLGVLHDKYTLMRSYISTIA